MIINIYIRAEEQGHVLFVLCNCRFTTSENKIQAGCTSIKYIPIKSL